MRKSILNPIRSISTFKLGAFLIVMLFVVLSCSRDDDFTNPKNLSGTTWKCSSNTGFAVDIEYALLKFNSTTIVEGWTKYKDKNEQKDWTGSFTISDKKIIIDTGDDKETFTGAITGTEMNLTITDNVAFVFVKQ